MPDARLARGEVVVTADDGGQRVPWDDAIIAAHEKGVVSAVALTANGPAYEAMRARLRELPRLDVGVHLNLYDGQPLCSASEVGTLLGPARRFLGALGPVLRRYAAGRFDPVEIDREWAAQIERILGDGLSPTHLSSHYHLHMLPGLFPIAMRLARKYSLKWVRLTDEPPRWSAPGLLALAKTTVLWGLAGWNRRRAGSAMMLPARGIANSGHLGARAWRRVIAGLPHGPVEVVCHPGQSVEQTRALMSTEVGSMLRARLRIVGFHELRRPA